MGSAASGGESGDLVTRPPIEISPDDELQIYVRADGAPGMYLGDDGEVHGFYVDLERMIMDEMGQAYRMIAYDNVGPVAQLMKSGEAHIALAVPDLPDYRTFLALSDSYEVLEFVTWVRSGDERITGQSREEILASLSGMRVGVQARGHIYQVLRDYKDIEVVEYPTTTAALADLDNGLLDAVPDVYRIGRYYSELHGWDIEARGDPIITHRNTTGFSQVLHPDVLERYNAALRRLKADGRFDALYTSYFGE